MAVQRSWAADQLLGWGQDDFCRNGPLRAGSEYFIYECDEFHRNFLHFHPDTSIISGIAWDHHEVFPTRDDYNQAFREFFDQTRHTILWDNDAAYVGVSESSTTSIIDSNEPLVKVSSLLDCITAGMPGWRSRRYMDSPEHRLTSLLVECPSSLVPKDVWKKSCPTYLPTTRIPQKKLLLYERRGRACDYEKQGHYCCLRALTNRRQHFMKMTTRTVSRCEHVYWIPSYLSREDPNQPILTPKELSSISTSRDCLGCRNG